VLRARQEGRPPAAEGERQARGVPAPVRYFCAGRVGGCWKRLERTLRVTARPEPLAGETHILTSA